MLEGMLPVGTLKIHKPIQLNSVSADTNIIKQVIYGPTHTKLQWLVNTF